jgi:hypothetical protein
MYRHYKASGSTTLTSENLPDKSDILVISVHVFISIIATGIKALTT